MGEEVVGRIVFGPGNGPAPDSPDWRAGTTWTAPPDQTALVVGKTPTLEAVFGYPGWWQADGVPVQVTGWPAGSSIPAPTLIGVDMGVEVKPGAAYEHRTPDQLRQDQETAALHVWIENRHAQPTAELARKLVDAVLGA
jgi:hypothetical protein